MMWMRISIEGTFETLDPICDIRSMVRVYLDPVILAQGADIREEHREMVCTCEFDELPGTIVRSDIDPSSCLLIECGESRIIEISEIPHWACEIEWSDHVSQEREMRECRTEEEELIATSIASISFPCGEESEDIGLASIATIIDEKWSRGIYALYWCRIYTEGTEREMWYDLDHLFVDIVELDELSADLDIRDDECRCWL
jgi:hypothetical protein